MRGKLSKYIIYILFAYILMALAWWSVLLGKKNKEIFYTQIKYLESSKQNEQPDNLTLEIQKLKKEYQRQTWMILGEGAVFAFSILAGLWFIYRSYQKEIKFAQQQKDFLLSVTHELNSPLASIKLVIDTLNKRTLSKEKERQLYKSAESETNRLNTLVNNILLAAKVEGNYQYNYEILNFSSMIEQAVKKHEQKFPEVIFDYQKTQKIELDGDRETLISLLNNLLENSAKYGSGIVSIHSEPKERNLVLSVADNGKGISEEDQEKIFDKFYRMNKNGMVSNKGTGLGLFIVKQIVEAHNGSIEIVSSPDKGTCFVVTLPKRQN